LQHSCLLPTAVASGGHDVRMPISTRLRTVCAYGIGLLLLPLCVAWAQDAAQSLALLDDLEFKIEVGRHERLIKRRSSEGATLAPFASDGCSGNLSTGWSLVATTLPTVAKHHGDRPPWEGCCVAHDRLYHEGGASGLDARASFAARRVADEQLRLCVIKTGEDRLDALSADYKLSRDEVFRLYRTIADVMYRAVRFGGGPCSGLSWRWGFGWPQCD
jgi:hypothetical protein